MNPRTLVKLSNVVGIVSIVLLIYWVTTFITVEVFGLKVFRENISETFIFSIFGILALMFGALIVNIMFNLTRIAEKHNLDESASVGKGKKWMTAFVISIPIMMIVLFGGDYLTSKKKEKHLIQSAESILEENQAINILLAEYNFSNDWISKASKTLKILAETDKNLPNPNIIVRDQIDGESVYLSFSKYFNSKNEAEKLRFLLPTDKTERAYLDKVFNDGHEKAYYSSHDGNYELFYPLVKGNNTVVLHFSEYQRYGKIGS